MCLLAILIASASAPIAQRLQQLLPQPASIALVYLGVMSALVGFLTLMMLTVLGQVTPVERSLLSLVQPGAQGEPSSAYQTLTALELPDG